jgi:hypothetical protein
VRSGFLVTAILAATVVIAGTAPGQRPADRKKPAWPAMPRKDKKYIPVKKPAPVKKKPAETWPGLIARANKPFGLSVVLQKSRHDFYSEDVKRVVIGLDLATGRILGVLIVKGESTWGVYAAPAYVAFFPNKRVQARRAQLVWLDAAGWVKYLKKRVSAYSRE